MVDFLWVSLSPHGSLEPGLSLLLSLKYSVHSAEKRFKSKQLRILCHKRLCVYSSKGTLEKFKTVWFQKISAPASRSRVIGNSKGEGDVFANGKNFKGKYEVKLEFKIGR